jgi:hypothetical protein
VSKGKALKGEASKGEALSVEASKGKPLKAKARCLKGRRQRVSKIETFQQGLKGKLMHQWHFEGLGEASKVIKVRGQRASKAKAVRIPTWGLQWRRRRVFKSKGSKRTLTSVFNVLGAQVSW